MDDKWIGYLNGVPIYAYFSQVKADKDLRCKRVDSISPIDQYKGDQFNRISDLWSRLPLSR